MNSLLSAISGQFSKALLLSTMLPVVVFVLLALVLVVPQVPGTVPVLGWMKGLDSEWQLAAITLVVVLLTAILHNLNGPIIRFYEGYPWCDSWFGGWRKSVHQERMAVTKSRWKGLWTLLLDPEAQRHSDYNEVKVHWNDLARTLNTRYPDQEGEVLPTRLGNFIRSFESYSWRQYKIRAITLWPRLTALIDPAYAALIDDAKASLDFMLNASLLCGLLTILVAVAHLLFPVGLATARGLVPLVVEVGVLGGLCYFFYLAAISRAESWGMMVKGAFDLFRWKLLESLGYRYKPESLNEERALWDLISSRIILSDLTIKSLPAYERSKTPPTGARAEPPGVDLALLRGASRSLAGSLKVTLRVRNIDPESPATGVVVDDTLPEGWIYKWGSATGAVEVTGANPYHFKVPDLAPGAEAIVTYRAVPAAPPKTP